MKTINRFEKYFSIPYPKTNDCWEWKGGKTTDGYGKFWFDKTMKAHKVSYLLYKGKISKGLSVLHNCDNAVCVNPNHLRLGTQQENIKDRDNKGRGCKS